MAGGAEREREREENKLAVRIESKYAEFIAYLLLILIALFFYQNFSASF
jgi:hypothetical protein